MRLHFLGTGTSTGVPQLGCTCEVCRSSDVRDKRLRASVLVESDSGTRILIDCGPDFRQQMLDRPFWELDGVLLTHEHYDHVGGIDDLRPFSRFGDVCIYAERNCLDHLIQRMPYCFAEHKYPGVPQLQLHEISAGNSFRVKDIEVLPLRVMHGRLPILGFRMGGLVYITDMTELTDETFAQAGGAQILVLNGLRFEKHPTHQTIDEAITLSRKLNARHTYITHMSHYAGLHAAVSSRLPFGVSLAYDGLVVDCPE